MSDALSRNGPKELNEGVQLLVANCLAHGRRNFVDLAEGFPDQCRYVLEMLGKVYSVDAAAKQQDLTLKERLRLHQQESEPTMKALRQWMSDELTEKRAEPNSPFGKAIKYMLTHWTPLTLFLRQAGAPLDNNLVERSLKKSILYRKNSLFYRNKNGAEVGDLFMSLIHTCELNGQNSFHYLLEALRHPLEIKTNPAAWMPWTYLATLEALKSVPS